MRKVAFLIHFGPEIKPFIVSSIFERLQSNVNFTFLIKVSTVINKLDYKEITTSIYYDSERINCSKRSLFNKVFLRFDRLYFHARQASLREIGKGNYHFTKGSVFYHRLYDKYLGSRLVLKVFKAIYTKFASRVFNSEYLTEIFKANSITDLIYYGSNMIDIRAIQHTAQNMDLKLWHYVGNWKDLYTDNFLPVIPEKIFVWSNQMKEDLLETDARIKSADIIVSGNWYFKRLRSFVSSRSKLNVCESLDIKVNRPIILWALSQKSVFPKEHLLVKKIDEEIEASKVFPKPIVILRDNPFGSVGEHMEFYSELKNVFITENHWCQSKRDNFTFQKSVGEEEWLDLLYFSEFVVTTPSTVTLECLLMNKVCVNILFDETGTYSSKLSAFSSAPFYKELLNRPDVKMVENIKDFLDILKNPEDVKVKTPLELPDIIDGNKNSNLNDVVQALLQ